MTEKVQPPIERSLLPPDVESLAANEFPSVERRYYERLYATKDNVIVLKHSNRLAVVCVSPAHPVLAKGVSSVDFQVTFKLDRRQNDVSGKGKKGGQAVDTSSILAWLVDGEGERHAVRCNVRGKLIEVNERLVKEPALLASDPLGEGYIGIVLPKLPDGIELMKTTLRTEQEYQNDPSGAMDIINEANSAEVSRE